MSRTLLAAALLTSLCTPAWAQKSKPPPIAGAGTLPTLGPNSDFCDDLAKLIALAEKKDGFGSIRGKPVANKPWAIGSYFALHSPSTESLNIDIEACGIDQPAGGPARLSCITEDSYDTDGKAFYEAAAPIISGCLKAWIKAGTATQSTWTRAKPAKGETATVVATAGKDRLTITISER